MIKIFSLALICSIAFGCARNDADKIFINAVIYTLNSESKTANSMAIKDGKIIYIGNEEGSYDHSGDNTEIIDLKGNTVIPGLTDAHMHIEGTGESLQILNFAGTTSAEEIADKIRSAASSASSGDWIEGRGWDQNDWQVKKFPTSQILSDAAPNSPVVLRRVDGHAYWVNQKTLDLSGITANTPDPEGGRILRISGSNEPSGILIDNAMDLIADVKPAPSRELKKKKNYAGIILCS